MALLNAALAVPLVEECEPTEDLLIALHDADRNVRRAAARALGASPEAFHPLAQALMHEHEGIVVAAMLDALAQMHDPRYVDVLQALLASDDALVRNQAVDAWQSRGPNEAFLAALLLTHADPDVRILAISVLRAVPGRTIEPYLLTLLELDRDPNVCAAAIDLLAEIGTREGIDVLREVADRFKDEESLRFAIDLAVAQMDERNEPHDCA